jgi:phosphomannomutase
VTSYAEKAAAWLAAEPDDDIRAELSALIEGDESELARRFDGHLRFGTAGLRAEVGAGPLRMNRLVVRQAAAGLADWLMNNVDDAAQKGVVIGYDARRKSELFALDTALVLAGRGVRSMVFSEVVPTPVLAWSVTRLGAASGVMVTASHNPPADNGYKVYLETGSQIVSPVDEQIAEAIVAVDPLSIGLAEPTSGLVAMLDREIRNEYLESTRSVRYVPDVAPVGVAYTPLHGVGGATLVEAFERCGLSEPVVVDEQFQPDGSFPTVNFPNPEEPGAMDAVINLAKQSGSVLALANDPDGDRLGVAIPTSSGWRRLSGDEIGWLLADHILTHTSGDDRMVVTTLVSSSLLSVMAQDHGVHSEETFTGFKWIGRTVLNYPDRRFVFGYEQALGYLVAQPPLDKDGITAAVLMAEVAACAAAESSSIETKLGELAERYGRYVIGERSIKMSPALSSKVVQHLQAEPPHSLGGVEVENIVEFPEAGLLRLMLSDGTRLQVRPSGTEPKIKLYGEAVNGDPEVGLDYLVSVLDEIANSLG